MEVKSLLVHSDGECAVVLVIDSNHSPLDKRRDLERERAEAKERKRERGRERSREETRHTPTFHFCHHARHIPTFPAPAFHKLPAVVPGCCLSSERSPSLQSCFLSFDDTRCESSRLENGRENGRGGRGGIWESKGGERRRRVEINSHEGPAASSQLEGKRGTEGETAG